MTKEAKRIVCGLREFELNGYCEDCPLRFNKNCSNGCLCVEAADLIERLSAELKELRDAQRDPPKAELEAKKSDGWIAVCDDIPEEFEHVLVLMQSFDDYIVSEGYICADGLWRTFKFEKYQIEVTHWMPLPEAPSDNELRMKNPSTA